MACQLTKPAEAGYDERLPHAPEARPGVAGKVDVLGHAQHVDGIYADCDRDTLLVQVHQDGVACHTGARSCFFTRLDGGEAAPVSKEGAGPQPAPRGTVQPSLAM